MKAYPELTSALIQIVERIDQSVRESGYTGVPISMYLAGGLAVNYYCGTRYTEDIDASFSRRLILPKNLEVTYTKPGGVEGFIYFDENYNTSFALLHQDFERDSNDWSGIGNDRRLVQLRVLAPVDLAVSKIARFSDQDREDIRALAAGGLVTAEGLRQRALEATGNYIGNLRTLMTSIDLASQDVQQAFPKS